MKTFNRYSLPEQIKYNGKAFTLNTEKTALLQGMTDVEFFLNNVAKIAAMEKDVAIIVVKVYSHKLKGRTDLHGKPYQPTTFIFSEKLKNK